MGCGSLKATPAVVSHVSAVGPAAEAKFKPTANQTVLILLAVITGYNH